MIMKIKRNHPNYVLMCDRVTYTNAAQDWKSFQVAHIPYKTKFHDKFTLINLNAKHFYYSFIKGNEVITGIHWIDEIQILK